MSIPGSASPLFFQTAAGAGTVTLQKSVRFNQDDSANLSRSVSSASNRRTWTFSCWLKKSELYSSGSYQDIIASGNTTAIGFDSIDQLRVYESVGGTVESSSVRMRDLSAWYSIVIKYDTTQATATDRVFIYLNGVDITNKGASYPAQNYESSFNLNQTHYIGRNSDGNYLAGYLADCYLIDGSALDPTSFGAFDDNGVWQAAAYSGTFGTNGFHLFDFANESGIGDDSSGNDNDFTVNNINLTGGVDPTSPASGNIYSNNYFGYYLNGNPPLFLTYDPSSTNRADSIAHGASTGTTWAVDDVLQWAIDWDAGKIWLGRNNTWYASGNPAGGTNPAISSFSTAYTYFLALGYNSNNFELQVPSSASYTPPTGFSYWGGQTLSTFKNSGTNQGGTPDIFKTAIPKSGKTYIEAIIKGGTNTYVTLGLCNFGETTLTSDVLRDVPTNGDAADDTGAGGELSANYCVLNPLDQKTATLTNGNLEAQVDSDGSNFVRGTIAVSSGKYYWEFTTLSSNNMALGVVETTGTGNLSDSGSYYYYANGGALYGNSSGKASSWGGSTLAVGDVLGVALDMDNGTLQYYKNGSLIGTAWTGLTGKTLAPAIGTGGGSSNKTACNFGQRAFAYGNAGTNRPAATFKALCTSNLPTPTIADGSAHFDAKLYQGNGTSASSTQAITGFSFSPNLVWMKARSVTAASGIYDTVRGVTERLASEKTAVYQNEGYFESFDSSGFTVKGNSNNTNANNETYVAWCWNIPVAASSNSDGTITSSVTKNADAGVSIVTWTGTGSAGTIGHGLNSKPDLIIVKVYGDTTYSDNWPVYSSAFDGTHYAYLNDTRKFTDFAGFWNDGTATSTVFPVGSYNSDNTKSLIAYCFTSVDQYSRAGVYTGNGSNDGPFIHTNFRPKFILSKRTDSTSDWSIVDSERNGYNFSNKNLYPNGTYPESTGTVVDILSNGFKWRTTLADFNASGGSFIYLAFAENPFQANGGLAR